MSTIILGIESSCDDTSAAIIKDGILLSNVIDGEQNLYTLTLTVPGDEFKSQVGYRDLKMVRNFNSNEEAYPLTFEINGKRIFARGINWVPIDMMFSRIDEASYERQVRLAKEGNFNLFRVWGLRPRTHRCPR